jgi:hypothetical protein
VSWLSEAGELQGKPPRQASSQNQNGKRKVVVAREKGDKTITKDSTAKPLASPRSPQLSIGVGAPLRLRGPRDRV